MAQQTVPDERQVLAQMAEAEAGAGWLSFCADSGRFLIVTAELVESLVEVLSGLASGELLEVAAGGGELAAALRAAGCAVTATDSEPCGGDVLRLQAAEALRRFQPAIVLGCFVPAGSGVDAAVLAAPPVRDYVVINARIGGVCGDPALWNTSGWLAEPLPEISQRLITRHDVWLAPGRPILRRGEAWHFRRWSESG